MMNSANSSTNSWLQRDPVYVGPMLSQCWASVVDGGPALAQHRANVSRRQNATRKANPVNAIHSNNIPLMLGLSRKRWINVKPMLF